jgi:hypothetical protein
MDIITRHLDQTLTRSELDELGEHLLRDRELAIAFARAARLDQSLEEAFDEQANLSELDGLIKALKSAGCPGRSIPRLAITCAAIAAAVALCFGIFQLWPRNGTGDDSLAARSSPAGKRIQRPSVRLPQTRLSAILPRESGTDAEDEARLRQRLSRFYLPATSIENLPLDEALDAIRQSVHSLDQLASADDEPIAIGLVDDGQSLDPHPTVSLERSNISVLNALNLLAMQSGYELVFSPPGIKLAKGDKVDAAEVDAAEFYVRTYRLPMSLYDSGPYRESRSTPAIFSPDGSILATTGEDGVVRVWNSETGDRLGELQKTSKPGAEATDLSLQDIPEVRFAADGGSLVSTLDLQPLDWTSTREVLRTGWGLELADESTTGSYHPGTAELVLNTSPAEHARLSALISEAIGSSASSSPITISTKLISMPPDLAGATDRIVNADEWQEIIRDWRQREVDIFSSPAITARIGSEVSAEILTTRFVEVNQEPGANFGEITVDRATGLRLPFTTSASGEQITVSGRIEQSMNEDQLSPEMLEELGGSDPDSPIVQFITEIAAPLFPGQVAIFECESHEPGRKVIAAVGISWEAPTPIPARESAAPPVPTPDLPSSDK